jgi:hypothetical protein
LNGGHKTAADPGSFEQKPAAWRLEGVFRPEYQPEGPLDQVLFQAAFIKVHLLRALNLYSLSNE